MKNSKIGPTKQSIMEVLVSLQLRYGKAYCFPTQKKILELLEKYHNIKIGRRALNYALADLTAAGMISRVRRIKHAKTGEMIFKSSLYFIRQAGHKFINTIKKYGDKIIKWIESNATNRAERRMMENNMRCKNKELILMEAEQ